MKKNWTNFSWVACWGLAKRYLLRTVRSFKNIIVSLLAPIIMLIAFGPAMNNYTQGNSSSLDYIGFFVPGIIALTLFYATLFSASTIVQWDKFTRFEEIITLTPNTPSTVILGYALGGFLHSVMEVVIVVVLSQFFVFAIPTSFLIFLYNILAIVICSGIFLFLGIAIAKLLDWERYTLVTSVLSLPLVYLSSIFAPTDTYGQFAWLVGLNPLSVLLVGLRDPQIPQPPVTYLWNLLLLSVYCLTSFGFCVFMFHRKRHPGRKQTRKTSLLTQKLQNTGPIHLKILQTLGMDVLEQIYHHLLNNNKEEALALFRSKFTDEEIYRLFEDLKSAQTLPSESHSDQTKG
ncbi:MAG: daunorubicin resistance ABC transporter, inner membrane subunit B [Promethearchaeota archaeon CR_4]|nr:MAG: daunorubicin resistance ABC transporter, inner membrane subunit B [Candidatus Lokiarchaeota archaeon CR_4]